MTLTNEQATILYNILSGVPLNRDLNRVRWSFLKLLEKDVDLFEKLQKELLEELQKYKEGATGKIPDILSYSRAKKEFSRALEDLKAIEHAYDIDPELESKMMAVFSSVKTETLGATESKMYAELEIIFGIKP